MTDDNLSSANTWRAFDEWFKSNVVKRQPEIHSKVTEELFKDGCHSAWVHRAYVIEALLDRIEDLEDEVKNG